MKRILITGAEGQIGSDLAEALRDQQENARVICTDVQKSSATALAYERLDVRDRRALEDVIERHEIDIVFHLASLLSARGEKQPDRTWSVNMRGLKNVLDAARQFQLRVFWPSSIAVFGPGTPRQSTPQQAVQRPNTMYGVTKSSGELLCRYYHRIFSVDVRSLRYPGLVSYKAPPGGGTTDYAVGMFYAAARGAPYTCFVRPDTQLPMMYMPDALTAALQLMDADPDRVPAYASYNVAAFSVSAQELVHEIQRHVPFTCRFEPDERQAIADAWPASLDDTAARRDWGWQPTFGLEATAKDMLEKLRAEQGTA